MQNTTIVAALPIGEFDTEPIRAEFDAIVQAFERLGAHLHVADPVSDEETARQAVMAFSDQNPDLLLLVPLRGLSAQAMEAAARAWQAPCLIWPIQGRYALPSSTLAVGALREAGLPVVLLYAPPDHAAAIESARAIAAAAHALARIRRSRIGVIGGLFPNLVACRYDPQTVNARLGATLLPVAYEAVRAGMAAAAARPAAIAQARQAIGHSTEIPAADQNTLAAGLTLHLALKQLAREHGLDAFAAECWTGLPRELGLNPCLGLADDAYILACEGDVMLAVSLLLVRTLTGRPAYVGDLYDVDLAGQLTLVHCGAPAALASNQNQVVLAKSQLAKERGFETLTCRPRLAPGPVTVFRLYGQNCDKMHICLAELLSCDQSRDLAVTIKLAGSRGDFLNQCHGNHYVVAAQDLRRELNLVALWLGITTFET